MFMIACFILLMRLSSGSASRSIDDLQLGILLHTFLLKVKRFINLAKKISSLNLPRTRIKPNNMKENLMLKINLIIHQITEIYEGGDKETNFNIFFVHFLDIYRMYMIYKAALHIAKFTIGNDV